MIHYQLRCSASHGFDGWFRNSAAFDKQSAAGLVSCPICGDVAVNRALMAPRIGKGGVTVDPSGAPQPVSTERTPAPPVDKASVAVPDHVRSMLQKLRAEIEKNCDYVGPGFADEARRMHRGDSDKRSIYGESTPEQAEALADEGIEVARIPWVPRADG